MYEEERTAVIDAEGVPSGLTYSEWDTIIDSVIQKESNYNPDARGSLDEIGLMQVRPATAEEVGVNRSLLTDPFSNITAGVRYLKKQVERFGLINGLAAYNAGAGRLMISKAQQYAASVLKIFESKKKSRRLRSLLHKLISLRAQGSIL